MQAERSHLLVPVWWSSRLQSPTSTQLDGPVSFVVPGVAESSEAFLISLTGLQRVPHQRVTGGIHVALEELPFDSLIMLSDDPRAISQVTRYLRRIAPRAAKFDANWQSFGCKRQSDCKPAPSPSHPLMIKRKQLSSVRKTNSQPAIVFWPSPTSNLLINVPQQSSRPSTLGKAKFASNWVPAHTAYRPIMSAAVAR